MLQELDQRALRRLAKLPPTLPSTYLRDVPIAKEIRNVLFPLHVIDTDVSPFDAAPDGQRFLVLDPGICRRRRRSSTGRRCRLRQLTESLYSLSSLRYDLSNLRAKDLVEKLPHSRRYRVAEEGYPICLVYLKLFERVYAPYRGAPGAVSWRSRSG